MINHLRSLLLNVKSVAFPGKLPIGEEPIPSDYRVRVLPEYAKAARVVLFGLEPDRSMLNYRVNQLLTLIHSTEVSIYLKDFDPRITYPVPGSDWPASYFEPEIREVTPVTGTLIPHIAAESSDIRGRMTRTWNIRVGEFTVDAQLAGAENALAQVAVSTSVQITLPGSANSVTINGGESGDMWLVQTRDRPTRSYSHIAADLLALQEEDQRELFGLIGKSQFKPQLNALWKTFDKHFELPVRVAAAALALAYRTEETA